MTLSGASLSTVTVAFATGAEPLLPASTSGVCGGLSTFSPGVTTRTISVTMLGDRIIEGTEQFYVDLVDPINATAGDMLGVCTIIDAG